MTMQQRPNNPIAQRKQQVRKHSRNAVISVAGGLGAGVVLGVLSANLAAWMVWALSSPWWAAGITG